MQGNPPGPVLDEMEQIIPWHGLCEVIEPFYPKPEGAGRPPVGLERMLRIHLVAVTAANVHDSRVLGDLLRGEETRVWGDSAYTGQGDVIRQHAPKAKDFTHKKGCRSRPLTDEDRGKNRTKSKVRSKVEHPFLVFKRVFGFSKVRYRGLDKNANRVFVACGLINLYMARKLLLRPT